ncbi:hypothetical protein [Marinicella sp. W31]|uniref:hypothetical protein n=1 Tax=Marinicella sp. W31 TaxID=3023713 RepID=UPI0037579B30
MFSKIVKVVIMLFPIQLFAQDLFINDDVQIPSLCENLPVITNPVDLSGACLAAQLAANDPISKNFANELCQRLEGITAAVGVIQIEVNKAHDICKTAFGDLQNQMFSGINDYHLELSAYQDLLKRLNNIRSLQDLLELLTDNDGYYLNEDIDDWQEVYAAEDEKHKSMEIVGMNYLEVASGADFLSQEMLEKGNAERQLAYIDSLQERAGEGVSLKESQDITVRMMAELAMQSNVSQQLLNQYLRLEAAESMKKLSQENYYHRLLTGDRE